MALTQTANFAKRAILFSIILSILGMVGFTTYKIWYAHYLSTLPPVEEKPNLKFGNLPPPDFPKNESRHNFSYILDTDTGGLPNFGKIIKVFFIPKQATTLLSADRSTALAEKFNLTSPPEVLTDTNYRYTDGDKSLTVDLESENFSYQRTITQSGEPLDDDTKLIQDFKNLLSSKGLLKEPLRTSPTKVSYLKFDGDTLIPISSKIEAQAVQISIWPAQIDQKPILSGNFNKALINGTVIGSANSLENYLFLNFIFWPVETSTFATYKLKTSQEAFDDLKRGQGTIIVISPKLQVSITSVYLAYFQSQIYSPYLQPIFVFEGPNFVAYVSAIKEETSNQAR